jgi:Fe-S-cluster containining protein
LSFGCTRCGRCCAGPWVGYVWVTPQEIAAIAGYLDLAIEQMHQTYVRSVGGGWSLREHRDNHDCLFLSPTGPDGRNCLIYPVRPTQCRTWPFWPDNLRSPEAWDYTSTRCPGVNCGEYFSLEKIQTRQDATAR